MLAKSLFKVLLDNSKLIQWFLMIHKNIINNYVLVYENDEKECLNLKKKIFSNVNCSVVTSRIVQYNMDVVYEVPGYRETQEEVHAATYRLSQ